MSDYRIDFENSGYLLLLALVPLLWWATYRSLRSLGVLRRVAALALRSVVLTLLVLSLAGTQLVRNSQSLTVIYLIDHSLSITPDQTDLAIKYVNEAMEKQRNRKLEDRAGVIVFGREPAIEIPPLDDDQRIPAIESPLDREYTNLAGAMKFAQASFPHDAAKRIVILTDGNENIGDALAQARSLIDAEIGIDVVPIYSAARGEVAVEKVTLPADVRRGQPFNLRVVLNNTTRPEKNGGNVAGRLQVVRKAGEHEQILVEQKVSVEPGKHVYEVREEIKLPDFYTYEARFIPDNPLDDAIPQNNRATTFTHVRGSGQVLFIEDHDPENHTKGDSDHLVERLRAMNLEVSLRTDSPDELFTDLGQLQPFDTVVLANVPREHFTDEQISMLVRNTQNMGSGLIMLGGSNSFGAGGWTNTPLEEAMPLDFQIKNLEVAPVGALALLMHASELAQGNHWQKVVAREAIEAELRGQDYCGLLHWGGMTGSDEWLWNHPRGMVRVGSNRTQMLARLDGMTPGDMPGFDPAMNRALREFQRIDKEAGVKHMIIISDGDPTDPTPGVMAGFVKMKIKVSTVAVGTHGAAGSTLLQSIANRTGGKYYVVNNASMLPRIYQKEARKISRPLIYEKPEGFVPQIVNQHEIVRGIGNELKPITGFVMTTIKPSALVEKLIVSPQPPGQVNSTILAAWTYGLGRTVAFTTDSGKLWASRWHEWENYDKLFSQMVRWSMRPVGDTGKFAVATDVEDGKIKVVVTALDQNDEFLNFLNVAGSAVGPDMKPLDLDLKQVAPGRYVGQLDAKTKGNYFVMLNPGPGRPPIRAGVNVPYSAEFRERETNEGLLRTLAGLTPKGGTEGKFIEPPKDARTAEDAINKMLTADTFRHDLPKATSSQAVWHLLVLAASCLFFFDVLVRRVNINFAWVGPMAGTARDWLLRRQAAEAPTETIERLRSRKAEVSDQLEQKRASVRFEPSPDVPPDSTAIDAGLTAPEQASPKSAKPAPMAPQGEEESYTARLLKAKQKVWEQKKKP